VSLPTSTTRAAGGIGRSRSPPSGAHAPDRQGRHFIAGGSIAVHGRADHARRFTRRETILALLTSSRML
jgi:hypothetical protein